MDGEFFYLLHKACHTPQTDAVIALDMRNKTLQGFADLVTGKDFTLTRCCTSEISKYLCKDKGNFAILVSALSLSDYLYELIVCLIILYVEYL